MVRISTGQVHAGIGVKSGALVLQRCQDWPADASSAVQISVVDHTATFSLSRIACRLSNCAESPTATDHDLAMWSCVFVMIWVQWRFVT